MVSWSWIPSESIKYLGNKQQPLMDTVFFEGILQTGGALWDAYLLREKDYILYRSEILQILSTNLTMTCNIRFFYTG